MQKSNTLKKEDFQNGVSGKDFKK